MSDAIETHLLSRKFGALIAVQDLDLRIPTGAIYGLLGPNGAGKSTTIKMLITLLTPSSGTASVAGFDILADPAEVRRNIGYVPQLVSADGGLTGYENLMLSAKLYLMSAQERKPRIHEALQFIGLTDAAQRPVKTYSGGMIRRLEVAQATLHRPKVLFLDEPTIGLDPVARQSVWKLLFDLREDFGITILLTTHDMEEADVLCDTLGILHLGKMVISGKPADLKASISLDATLADVFVRYSGGTIQEGGGYRDVKQTRRTAHRLG